MLKKHLITSPKQMLQEIKRIHDHYQQSFNNNMAYWTEERHTQELMADQIDMSGNQSTRGKALFAGGEYRDAVATMSRGRLGSTRALASSGGNASYGDPSL